MRTGRWQVGAVLGATLVLATIALGACAGPGADGSGSDDAEPATAVDAGSAETGSPAPVPAASVTVSATVREQRPITIAFAGDVHFEGQLRSLLDNPETALEPIAAQLSAADLTVLNLETAVGTGGPRESKEFTFQAPPDAFDALAAAGVDVVSMANNHAGDYGLEGFADTLAAADGTLRVVGIGTDVEQAFAPAVFDVDGTKVAVLGASAADHDRTADPTGHWAAGDDSPGVADAVDPAQLVEAVETARSAADVVAVYLHWGIQGDSCPSGAQKDLAVALADAGADIVVGSHAHRLQGAGIIDDTYVAYGLGNFVWYTQASAATSTTGVLTLTVEDRQVVADAWAPAVIESDGLPRFAGDNETESMRTALDDLRACTSLEPLDQ